MREDAGASTPPPGSAGDLTATPEPDAVIIHAEKDVQFVAALQDRANPRLGKHKLMAEILSGLRIPPEDNLPRRLERAPLLVAVLSPDFFASGGLELLTGTTALEARLVPILWRPCSWESTLLARYAPLPRSRVPIAEQANPEEAYSQIVEELEQAFGEVASAGFLAPGELTLMERPAPSPGYATERVFQGSRAADLTFVPPVEYARLRTALARPDVGLVVEGPSRIGKTTAVRHALRDLERDFRCLLPHDQEVDSLRRPEDVQGWVIVDDFHSLDVSQQERISGLFKDMNDRASANRKLVIVGVGDIARTILGQNPRLYQSFETIKIRRQPAEKVKELLAAGEAALNVVFVPQGALEALSNGSLAVAQQLAARALEDAGIVATCSTTTPVWVHRRRLIEHLLEQLRMLFEDDSSRIVRADDSMPKPRGVYLALLWLLSRNGGGVRISRVSDEYPQFSESIRSRRPGELLAPLRQGDVISVALSIDKDLITVVDPHLSLYLAYESFVDLAVAGGLGDSVDINGHGMLKFRGLAHENPTSPVADVPIWCIVDADQFWQHPQAEPLKRLLASAYTHIQSLLDAARRVDIQQEVVAHRGRADLDVARDVLEHARAKGVVKRLLQELRKDEDCGGSWARLDELLGLPPAANQ